MQFALPTALTCTKISIILKRILRIDIFKPVIISYLIKTILFRGIDSLVVLNELIMYFD